MNNVNRTLTRCIGYGCLVGGLLVSAPALASGTWIKNTSGSIDGGTYIKVDARAKWTAPDQSVTRYKNLPVNIAKSTLRSGALAAVGRGVMHPGIQLAVAAAGFVFSNSGEVTLESSLDPSDYPTVTPGDGYYWSASSSGGSPYYDGVLSACQSKMDFFSAYNLTDITPVFESSRWKCSIYNPSNDHSNSFLVYRHYAGGPIETQMIEPDVYSEPVTGDDLAQIDPHIPPQLADELFTSQDDIPEWEDTISVMGMPASSVDPGTKNMPPEVADIIGKWVENMDASFNGEEAPNPDDPTTGNTAEEQVAEETLEGDVPPFPDQEIAWQTESVDLPSYSSGIGDGSCPAPVSIALPLSADPIELSYQPACDLATMVRPALVGICGLIALMIVLRARGGA